MTTSEKLAIIEKNFYGAAMNFAKASRTARESLSGSERIQALGDRALSLDQANILLDAYSEFKNDPPTEELPIAA